MVGYVAHLLTEFYSHEISLEKAEKLVRRVEKLLQLVMARPCRDLLVPVFSSLLDVFIVCSRRATMLSVLVRVLLVKSF